MDKVFIEGLQVEAVIGIHPWERGVRQKLLLDVVMSFDNRVPAASDEIGDAHDYEAIATRLVAFASKTQVRLVETLAERCAALVLEEFGVRKVKLTLTKPGALPGARAVGVVVKRERDDDRDDDDSDAAAGGVEAGDAAAAPVVVAGPEVVEAPVVEARVVDAPVVVAEPGRTRPAATVDEPARAAPPAGEDARALASRFRARLRVGREADLSLGSNVEPERNLRAAVAALRERFGAVVVSPVYRTAAVGFEGPDFLNAVARIECDTDPFALHRWLHKLEEAHGRDSRDADYSNRPLDLDIVYFGNLVLDVGVLQLPRPELRYAFVLKPMADIAPDFMDPLREASMAELWAAHPERDTPPARVDLAL